MPFVKHSVLWPEGSGSPGNGLHPSTKFFALRRVTTNWSKKKERGGWNSLPAKGVSIGFSPRSPALQRRFLSRGRTHASGRARIQAADCSSATPRGRIGAVGAPCRFAAIAIKSPAFRGVARLEATSRVRGELPILHRRERIWLVRPWTKDHSCEQRRGAPPMAGVNTTKR
jgi:hypothetical protein